jgi:hypothetical protein
MFQGNYKGVPMGYLQSIRDEYDRQGNYIGNSDEGNAFHGLQKAEATCVIACARCGSTTRMIHPAGGTICGKCECAETQWKCR